MALKVCKITWKQAMAWGWASYSSNFNYINAATGRVSHRGDRLGRNVYYTMGAFARQGREDNVINPRITRRVGDTLYEISMPPKPICTRCGKRTWDIYFLPPTRCRIRCERRI